MKNERGRKRAKEDWLWRQRRRREEKTRENITFQTKKEIHKACHALYLDIAFILYLFGDAWICLWLSKLYLLCYLVSSCLGLDVFLSVCVALGDLWEIAFSPPIQRPCCRDQQDKDLFKFAFWLVSWCCCVVVMGDVLIVLFFVRLSCFMGFCFCSSETLLLVSWFIVLFSSCLN